MPFPPLFFFTSFLSFCYTPSFTRFPSFFRLLSFFPSHYKMSDMFGIFCAKLARNEWCSNNDMFLKSLTDINTKQNSTTLYRPPLVFVIFLPSFSCIKAIWESAKISDSLKTQPKSGETKCSLLIPFQILDLPPPPHSKLLCRSPNA